MKEIMINIFGLIIGVLFMIFLFLVFLTPEKDKFGNYTNFSKYWTSDEYFCSHFDIGGSYCNKINNK